MFLSTLNFFNLLSEALLGGTYVPGLNFKYSFFQFLGVGHVPVGI